MKAARPVSRCLCSAGAPRRSTQFGPASTAVGGARCQNTHPNRRAASTSATLNQPQNRSIGHQNTPRFFTQHRHASSTPISTYQERKTAKEEAPLNRTALHDLHLEHGARMVPFGGFLMPVQYSDLSVGESHKWTREKASLFDVGHMVQHIISGPGATAFLSLITPSSLTPLPPNHSTLSCLLHPVTGGIVDDTVITRLGPEAFYLVTNAACKDKDLAYLQDQLSSFDTGTNGKVDWKVRGDWGLVALQGPLSAEILLDTILYLTNTNESTSPLDLETLLFGQCHLLSLASPSSSSEDPTQQIIVSRGGYTGEDGFEIAFPPSLTLSFVNQLLSTGTPDRLRLAGLGARDSLRLEAGMCLYGHDLDDETTPVQAGLGWVVAKDRRTSGGFHGSETILCQLKPKKEGGGIDRRRVGLVVDGAVAREGAEIVSPSPPPEAGTSTDTAEAVGKVTSGCPSPTLGVNIAMGYVRDGMHKSGTELEVVVRGKRRKAKVTKMPFVPSRYWKGKGQSNVPPAQATAEGSRPPGVKGEKTGTAPA